VNNDKTRQDSVVLSVFTVWTSHYSLTDRRGRRWVIIAPSCMAWTYLWACSVATYQCMWMCRLLRFLVSNMLLVFSVISHEWKLLWSVLLPWAVPCWNACQDTYDVWHSGTFSIVSHTPYHANTPSDALNASILSFTADQMYQSFGRTQNWVFYSTISPTFALFFYESRSKSGKFGLNFRLHSPLNHLRFGTNKYRYQSKVINWRRGWLTYILVHWGSLPSEE